MTSPLEDTYKRAREGGERQSRQIQSGRVVKIDRTTLPWTLTAEFVTAHNEAYQIEGITLDPVIALPDSAAIFVLPRNEGDGAEQDTQAPVIAVEVSRGEADEAASITGFHADFTETAEGRALAFVDEFEAQYPATQVRYVRGGVEGAPFLVIPRVLVWTDDVDGSIQAAGHQPSDGSANMTGEEINLIAGNPEDIRETAIRVWLEPLADGGRVNIVYGGESVTGESAIRHVADIPLVHPSAVNGGSGKIRTEPADPAVSDGSSAGTTGIDGAGDAAHDHPIPHTHTMAQHYHEIPILAVRPIRIWYAE